MSRQKYGSKNYYKTLHKYWKWIDKRNNIVEDFLHKLSYTIVMNHQSIFMETLNIKGMMQNENFAAKLHAISISKFISMMEYKCHWNQRNFIQVSMFFPSSKMCNICKEKYEELELDMRTWTCPHCNTTHDRDINAAKKHIIWRIKNISRWVVRWICNSITKKIYYINSQEKFNKFLWWTLGTRGIAWYT